MKKQKEFAKKLELTKVNIAKLSNTEKNYVKGGYVTAPVICTSRCPAETEYPCA